MGFPGISELARSAPEVRDHGVPCDLDVHELTRPTDVLRLQPSTGGRRLERVASAIENEIEFVGRSSAHAVVHDGRFSSARPHRLTERGKLTSQRTVEDVLPTLTVETHGTDARATTPTRTQLPALVRRQFRPVSPRARGRQVARQPLDRRVVCLPARAGTSDRLSRVARRRTVYPRACGAVA